MRFPRQKYSSSLLLIIISWLYTANMFSQDTSLKADSISTPNDSVEKATPQTKKKSGIEFPIKYKANDSIVLSGSGNAYLYGEGDVDYEKVNLKADYIKVDLDSATIYAVGRENEEGEIIGSPDFKDGGDAYKSKSIRYNINTKKGYIKHGVVQQGEGYIIGEQTKKVDNDIVCMRNGKYTTCDNHDHPHFYLNLTKAKVKQNKWIVTGPAYFVLLDIPLPLAIPFGYFPFNKEYSSGIIIPSYGTELTRGFYLANGGYYFALSDYMDLTLTGDIYTMGTWAIYGRSKYLKKYKFNGYLDVNYREDVAGERNLPNFSKQNNFSINWRHSQDPKASPNSTLSASVNFSSSGYDRSNINNAANPALLSQNTKSSSVSWGYNFPESPFSLSTNILANQRTSDSTISLTLPDLNLTMNRRYPFKRKNAIGKEKWYEKLSVSYNGRFSNSIVAKEYDLMTSSFKKDWEKGLDHNIPVNASFNLLKYITISPSATYHERWYFKSIEQSYDTLAANNTKRDTTYSFYRAYDFQTGISASTKLYGFYTPWRKLFGNKVDRIRHVMTPTVGFSYRPDFADPKWGFYSSYEMPTSTTDPTPIIKEYSYFEGGMYGTPSSGKSGSLNFSLNNNIEMKVRHKSDSSETAYKTVSLIDGFRINSSYNLVADSMNWSIINGNLRLKLFKGLNINLNGTFEPYVFTLNSSGNPQRVNTLRWDVGKMPRLINTGTSFGYTFNNKTFSKKEEKTKNQNDSIATAEKNAAKKIDNQGYEKFSLPWSLNFDYSVQFGNTNIFNDNLLEYERELTHNMSLRGNISLTTKWRINFGGAYDITNEVITYTNLGITRDLHCWSMSANIVPYGLYKTYNFIIQVSSSLLSDLKYEKRSDYTSAPIEWH